MYTERYMGTPETNPAGYNVRYGSVPCGMPVMSAHCFSRSLSSVLPQLATLASLDTSFLLVHGTGDDNVHFSNSAEIMKQLILNQIMFDVMVYPNQGLYQCGVCVCVCVCQVAQPHW